MERTSWSWMPAERCWCNIRGADGRRKMNANLETDVLAKYVRRCVTGRGDTGIARLWEKFNLAEG